MGVGRAKGSSEDQYSFHPRVYTAARMSSLRQTPLTCSGHTRPVVFLAFSEINSDGIYYSISACKDGKPMLRQGDTGDWIGTFEGHKGAVWVWMSTRMPQKQQQEPPTFLPRCGTHLAEK